jgi:hypothetical protein
MSNGSQGCDNTLNITLTSSGPGKNRGYVAAGGARHTTLAAAQAAGISTPRFSKCFTAQSTCTAELT